MHLKFSLTEEEYQEFIYYANWLSPDQKDNRFKYYFFNTITYLSFLAIILLSIRAKLTPIVSFITVIVFCILGLLYLKHRNKSFPYQVAHQLISQEGGSETILPQRQLTISEEGICIINNVCELKYWWQASIRKVKHNNCYYLYIGLRDALIIPERIFQSLNEKEEFDILLLTHLPLQAELDNFKQ